MNFGVIGCYCLPFGHFRTIKYIGWLFRYEFEENKSGASFKKNFTTKRRRSSILRYIDTVFLGRQNHDNQINAKFEKILFIILKLVAYY